MKGHGGGVLVAVKSIYESDRIVFPNADNVEIVCVKVSVRNCVIYVCCVYVPSNSDCLTYERYSSAIDSFMNSIQRKACDIVLVLGDFNFPNVLWLPDTDNDNILLPVNISNSNNVAADFIDSCVSYGLFQINSICNYNNRLLDLVFCSENNDVLVSKCDSPLSIVDPHHVPIDILLDLPVPQLRSINKIYMYNFKKADWSGLNVYFSSINWSFLF